MNRYEREEKQLYSINKREMVDYPTEDDIFIKRICE